MRWLVLLVILSIIGITVWRVRDGRSDSAAPVSAALPEQTAVPAPTTRPRPALPPSPAELQQHQLEKRRAVDELVTAGRSQLLGRYQSESTDAAWANAKELELMRFRTSTQIEAVGAKPSNLAIECKRTTCRIEADFPSRSAAEDWITLFSTESGGKITRAIVDFEPLAGGGVHLVSHGLARE